MRHIVPLVIAVSAIVLVATPATAENYAILFAGGIDLNSNVYGYYYKNALRMYDILTGSNFNFKPQNVWVLAADGRDPNVDCWLYNQWINSDWSSVVNNGSTVLAGTHDNLKAVIQSLPTGAGDLLYLWTFDHGGGDKNMPTHTTEERLYGWGNGNVIQDDELSNWVGNLVCGRKAFVFGQCYSGGMVDDLNISAGQGQFACAATNHYEPSNRADFVTALADSMDPNDPNHSYNYTRTYDIYQYAYTHDASATGGEGPGGTFADDVEHPWMTGDNLDLAVAVWTGPGYLWEDPANWRQQPSINRTVRVPIASAIGTILIEFPAEAGYLVLDREDPNTMPMVIDLETTLHTICQTIGDRKIAQVVQGSGMNLVDNELCLGNYAGAIGIYYLDDGNLVTYKMSVGRGGKGYFDQTLGTTYVSNQFLVGEQPTGEGKARLFGGNFTVGVGEVIGDQGLGRFEQTDGNHVVGSYLVVGREAGSNGTYIMSGGTLEVPYLDVGGAYTGTGSFSQSGGTVTVTSAMAVRSGVSASYTLSGTGVLSAPIADIWFHGLYRQTGGGSAFSNFIDFISSSSCGKLEGGAMDAGTLFVAHDANFVLMGGSLTVGILDLQTGGKFTQTGGTLSVTDPNCAYVGSDGVGTFKHTAGNVSVEYTLYIGYAAGSAGTYTFQLDPNLEGGLGADTLRIGADSGTGRFEYLAASTHVSINTVVLGAKGTLAMGYSTNVANISSGAIFGGATVTGLDQATLEATNGATITQDTGSNSYGVLRVGSGGGDANFRQIGGSSQIGYLEVNANGRYLYSGGSLNVYNGGLHVAGKLDFGSGHVTLSVGANSLVNLTGATIQNGSYATLHIEGPDTLTILPTGFDPNQFLHYSNSGRTHYAGSPLSIDANEAYVFQGHIADRVVCHGSLAATSGGYLDLAGGLEMDGSSTVDVGTALLTINGSGSCLQDSANLAAPGMRVGVGGTGAFTQSGGACSLSGDLQVGYDSNSHGVYTLTGGQVESQDVSVGYQGNGEFHQSGGSMCTIAGSLVIGGGAGGEGTYDAQDGNFVAASVYVGGDASGPGGTGSFSLGPGAVANVSGTVTVYSGGTLSVQDANLLAPAIEVRDGGAVQGRGRLDPNISIIGSGSVEVQGGDTLELGGLLACGASSILEKRGLGQLTAARPVAWGPGSQIRVAEGLMEFASSDPATVEPNSVLVIQAGAAVNAGGTADPFYDPNATVLDPCSLPCVDIQNSGTFNVLVGSKQVGAISLDPNTTGLGRTTVAAGASLRASQITQTSLELNGLPSNRASLTVRGGGGGGGRIDSFFDVFLVSADMIVDPSLLVDPNALQPSNTVVLKPGGLGLNIDPDSKLDLTTNNMIIDYTGGSNPLLTIVGNLATGCAGGAWNGNGISSSTIGAQGAPTLYAIGVVDNSTVGKGDLEGVPVDSNTVLVKFTWAGDADLDGQVTGADYDLIDYTWLTNGGEGSAFASNPWYSGDFNYDGVVNGADYDLIDYVWLTFGGPTTSLPEPATMALLALGGLAVLARRNRRN